MPSSDTRLDTGPPSPSIAAKTHSSPKKSALATESASSAANGEPAHPPSGLAAAPNEAGEDAPAPRDPLLQFGVLVPPALRAAQTSFRAGVLEGVIGMAQAWWALRAVEHKIEDIRTERSSSLRQ